MAGDWIKMRTDLYRDPKVCVIADLLISDDSELSRYVSQNKQRDMTVTRNVMRNVTVGSLVSVWGVLRHRGKRYEEDLVVKGCTLGVIDDVADIPGFGDAMAQVGWAVETEDGIVFPRFFEEFNVDPNEESKKKNAERQRRYREKQKGISDVTNDVTVASKSDAREEKRREDINTPITPKGVPAVGINSFLDTCKQTGELPVPEDDPVFTYAESVGIPVEYLRLAWREFVDRNRESGKRYKDWRKAYRNCIRSNWYRIWFISPDGSVSLTTQGMAAQKLHLEAA